MSGKEYVTRQAHERLWANYTKTLHELNLANQLIAKLQKTKMETTAVINKNGESKKSIGIVECPKCNQLMEVEA